MVPIYVVVFAGFLCATRSAEVLFQHHNNTELESVLREITAECPDITYLYSIGTTPDGNELWVLAISDNPEVHEIGEPEFKYIANMHGNEVVGREMLLHFANYLCEQYLNDSGEIVSLVRSMRIHLLPSMNPDGWSVAFSALQRGNLDEVNAGTIGRENSAGFDLNRNFPDLDGFEFQKEDELGVSVRTPEYAKTRGVITEKVDEADPVFAVETRLVIKWLFDQPFVLSANLHGGDLVANFPYDRSRSGRSVYSQAPDDRLFRRLARAYSLAHPTMHELHACAGEAPQTDFAALGGITNGAHWYSVAGGMQDFNYDATNCFELTLELGCDKWPSAVSLAAFWDANKAPLLNFVLQAHVGVKGVVVDYATGQPIEGAVISIKDLERDEWITHDVFTTTVGEYHRLLLDNTPYLISANADGYTTQARCLRLPRIAIVNTPLRQATQLNFKLMQAPFFTEWDADFVDLDSVTCKSFVAQLRQPLGLRNEPLEAADSAAFKDSSFRTMLSDFLDDAAH